MLVIMALLVCDRSLRVCVCVCMQPQGSQIRCVMCEKFEDVCIYICVICTFVFICMNSYMYMCRKCIFSECISVLCGNLFNRNCHVEASWHPPMITSCVLEYFLNCSELFRAAPNDFHNHVVTWPFTPCEKIPTHLNLPLH